MKIGITGQSGFLGAHLFSHIGLCDEQFEVIPFEDSFFLEEVKLRWFVKNCDVIVHLAGVSRGISDDELYNTNTRLTQQLIDALVAESVSPLVIFSSSTHEDRPTAYGRSKQDGACMLKNWAVNHQAHFLTLVLPNVFGPQARPFYCSFVSTFAYQLTHGKAPEIKIDDYVKLIFVKTLCERMTEYFSFTGVGKIWVNHEAELKVSEVLSLFNLFRRIFCEEKVIPNFKNQSEKNLFETFCSYIDYSIGQ